MPVEPRFWTERAEGPFRFGYVSPPSDFDSKLSAGQFLVTGKESHATRQCRRGAFWLVGLVKAAVKSLSPHL